MADLLKMTVDTTPFSALLDDVGRRQVPYAAANALNLVATGKARGLSLSGGAQEAERRRIAHDFTLRRPDFVLREGVKVLDGFATKARASITLGTSDRADFLAKFEPPGGSVKLPMLGASLAIPVDVKRNARDIVTRANRPRQLLNQRKAKKVFIVRAADTDPRVRGLTPGIYQRLGRNKNVRLLYALAPEVHVDGRLKFAETIIAAVNEKWGEAFALAFADAMRTAR